MKRLLILALIVLVASTVYAGGMRHTVEVIPTTTTYEVVKSGGDTGTTEYAVAKVVAATQGMGFSGTSVCQVIDISKLDIDGYFTFQMMHLTGATNQPLSGTTFNVYWRASNIDTEASWNAADRLPIFTNVNAYTGATKIVYDMNSITGVTPAKYLRIEFVSGISATPNGKGGVSPVGLLFIR